MDYFIYYTCVLYDSVYKYKWERTFLSFGKLFGRVDENLLRENYVTMNWIQNVLIQKCLFDILCVCVCERLVEYVYLTYIESQQGCQSQAEIGYPDIRFFRFGYSTKSLRIFYIHFTCKFIVYTTHIHTHTYISTTAILTHGEWETKFQIA